MLDVTPTERPTQATLRRNISHEKALFHTPLRAADAKRSVKNILQWNTYLPTDCVRAMVRSGWDYTT